MTHPCEEIADALRRLQAAGLPEPQLARLHPGGTTYRRALAQFAVQKAVRGPVAAFGERVRYVADETTHDPAQWDARVEEALRRWPLVPGG